MIPVYILANDKHLWLLRGFIHLFNTYWGGKHLVTIYGYNAPDFKLPQNFHFVSMGSTNAPASQWSNGLIRMCQEMPTNHFILMLEDYWLNREVDFQALETLTGWFCKQGALCLDLSGSRATKKQARFYAGFANGCTVISTPPGTPYQMSFQAAMWDRDKLLQVLQPDENPWQSEIDGSKRVDGLGLTVLGTTEAVIPYRPVYRVRRQSLDVSSIHPKQVEVLRKHGWLDVR